MAKKSDTGLCPVKFLRAHSIYVKGDIAGFDEALATQLIKEGAATDDLEADVGEVAAVADVTILDQLAEKDAEIAALRAQLEAAAKPAKAKADTSAGAPPSQGA